MKPKVRKTQVFKFIYCIQYLILKVHTLYNLNHKIMLGFAVSKFTHQVERRGLTSIRLSV